MPKASPDHQKAVRPVIGLALGSGAARGWAHLGVIRALQREGIEPQVISGCSVGAFVGAALASGYLERLTEWAESLKWQDVMSLMDVSLRGGLIKGQKLTQFVRRSFVDRDFSDLDRPFACVATDLETGREVWLRDGSVVDAVRASIALPGLLTPVIRERHVLVDGGLVNPVPVSLCRAMGADIVIAVDLGSDMVGKSFRSGGQEQENLLAWPEKLLERLGLFGIGGSDSHRGGSDDASLPSLITVMTTSINIMQVRIARSRLAGEPADVQISPRVGQLGPVDFHRAREAIVEGEAAVQRVLPALRYAIGHT
jgi:NTE family protein